MRIKHGAPNPRYATRQLRSQVYAQDRGICQYCGAKVTYAAFNVEHVVPWPDGLTRLGNLVTACRDCNKDKLRRYVFNPGKSRRQPAEAIRHRLRQRLVDMGLEPSTFVGFQHA